MANIANDLTLNTNPVQLGSNAQTNVLTSDTINATTMNLLNIVTNLIRSTGSSIAIQPSTDSLTGNITVVITPNTWTSTETSTLQFGSSSTETISATPTSGLVFSSAPGFTFGPLGSRFRSFYSTRASFAPGVTSVTTFTVNLPAFVSYRLLVSVEKAGVNSFVFQAVVDSYNISTGVAVIRVLRLDTNAPWTGIHFCNLLLFQI
jgi:hypothetical protein